MKILWQVITADGKKHCGKFLVYKDKDFEQELFRRANLHDQPTLIGAMVLLPDDSGHIRHYIKRGDRWIRVWTATKIAPPHMFWWVIAVIAFFIMLVCLLLNFNGEK